MLVIRPKTAGRGDAAQLVPSLDQRDLATGLGQGGGRGQAVDITADDDDFE